jgi:hypothetical protein
MEHSDRHSALEKEVAALSKNELARRLLKLLYRPNRARAQISDAMRSKAKAIYVRAEPLGKRKRRNKLPDNLVLFKNIHPRSLQRGVNSMQFAKNSRFLDIIRTCDALAISFDSATISKFSMHGIHMRAMRIVKKGPRDPGGTQRLGVVARSIVLDLFASKLLRGTSWRMNIRTLTRMEPNGSPQWRFQDVFRCK